MNTHRLSPESNRERIVDRCLSAFVEAGTLDLSLDDLAAAVGITKRMLVHYFGSKARLELLVVARFEDGLRARFRADAFPRGIALEQAVLALWEETTRPQGRGMLLLAMELTRRAWTGSEPAQAFYKEQQRLWIDLLVGFTPDPLLIDTVLQLFQGAILVFLITGNREAGSRALRQFFSKRC